MTLHGPVPKSDKVSIKAATAADLHRLTDLLRKYYKFDRIPFDRLAVRSGLEILLREKSLGRAWFIYRGRRRAGYVILTFGFDLEFGGRQATITDLYLEPRYRGKGVGREVLRLVEGFCKKSGVRALELQVSADNSRATRFYQRFGFQAHDRVPMSKQLG